jgi:uncharacterized protein
LLYGALHLPATAPGGPWRTGALLCNAFGEEHIRSHRTNVALAFLLAEAGVPTLRFDYYGTGDSQGGLETASRQQWLADVEAAAGELRRRTGAGQLTLVGLRLGATLAALAAVPTGADAIVLWDPIVDGDEYLTDLDRRYRRWLVGSFAQVRAEPGVLEIQGFQLSAALQAELRRIDLVTELTGAPARALIMRTSARPCFNRLAERLEQLGSQVSTVTNPACEPWSDDRDVAKGFGVLRGLRKAVAWSTRAAHD